MSLTVGSLFSGIGGLRPLDLGLERAGMRVLWQSEIDPYCSRVLARHWPAVPNLGDVTTIDWSTVESVDLICGGYPCQPFSLAGSRQGADDGRHLWPHMLNAVRHLRPRFALLENVSGHLSLGFGRVLGDLAEIGYDAGWDCIPAASVGAPHRRDRVFVVAWPDRYPDGERLEGAEPERIGHSIDALGGDLRGAVPDPDGSGRVGRARSSSINARWPQPTHSDWWAVEPDVGRVAHGIPDRVDRLRAIGNAVVPQVAEYIGRQIMAAAA